MARGPRVIPFPTGPAWLRLLRLSRNGSPINDLANVLIALRNEPGWTFAAAFEEMKQEIRILAPPPLAPDTEPGAPPPRFATPEDFTRAQEWLQRTAMQRIGKETVQDALNLFARERTIHPLRDWLRTRPDAMADGGPIRQPVLDNWLSFALGVPDDAYHREIGRRFAISMVARVMQPGCQCDYMMVLEGPQGEHKSSFCRALAGDEYFSDHLPSLNSDPIRVSMHLCGPWLIEVSELAAFSKVADVETLKGFLSRREEQFTAKYAKNERRVPRQCVFVGTTNDDEWIKDASGGRRFWPVKVVKIDLDWLNEYRDQLFAEAVEAYDAGEPWYPDPNFERRVIAPQQERRQWHDALTERVNEVIGPISEITLASLGSQLGFDNTRFPMMEQKRIANILKKVGWRKERESSGRMIWRKAENPEGSEPS